MTDIAIIGLACRFPAAANPRDFWHLVRDGLEVTQLPSNVAEFDADFFNLSPREACAMDPRQRLALELTWELFEDAFVVPEKSRGQRVSIYLGAMTDDYAVLTLRDAAHNIDHHSFAGISRGMIANRISYAFGLHGPSMTVDSGQSSSLVAVHLACESLRTGESPMAIAGGIHLNLANETAMLETEFGAVSTSGRTYAFDGRADGYVRGEGGALVLLKPLRTALEDGNRIRAIIRGSAVGNAGHSAAGQTVPSASGQADVIRRALSSAGLESSDVHYIEAHGTGTEIGDPVEARALGEIFAERQHRPVSLGSVKTNIGHAGSAAGIASLLKAVLAIENAMIPPSLNYASGIPGIDLKRLGLHVNTTLTPWPVEGRPRRAGVSSFGMGGTNAHVIVEQARAVAESVVAERDDSKPVVPWVLSGRSVEALAAQAGRLLAHVAADERLDPVDVGWSLVSTRSVFEHRAVVVGAERGQLMAGLAVLAAGEPGAGVVVGRARSVGKTVFVFPGQGSQWLEMGARLYERFPVFAEAFDAVADVLDRRLRLPLRQVVWGGDECLLNSTEFAQPALFAVEVALARLLQRCGVGPDFVMGHSVGELSAACVAGVLSVEDAVAVVAARGRLMQALPTGGVMVAVAASEEEVLPLVVDGVGIAAVNAPGSVVISGAEAAVRGIADGLARRGRRVHQLAVSHAFHSPLMEPMLDEFARIAAGVSVADAQIPVVSNVTGELAGPGYGSGQYWVDHVRRPVRFAEGVRLVESLGASRFVQVGPGGGLTASVEQSLTTEQAVSVASMAKNRPEIDSVLSAAGRLFVAGVGVDWSAVFGGLGGRRVELPTYAFQRQRFWLAGGERSDSGEDLSVAVAAASGGSDNTETAASMSTFASRLHGLAPDEQHRQLVELVCSHAATVLGHSSRHDIDPDRPFEDLGFDSLTGVELRDRLKTITGLALSTTLIYDYATPTAVADHLGQQLRHSYPEESDDEKLWSLLRKIPIHELRRAGLLDKLLLLAGEREKLLPDLSVGDDVIDSLSPDDLIAMANRVDEDDTP
jgi:acyl transferase domain-containing protein